MIYDYVIKDITTIHWGRAGPMEYVAPGLDVGQPTSNHPDHGRQASNGYNLISCTRALAVEVTPIWLKRNSIRFLSMDGVWHNVLTFLRTIGLAHQRYLGDFVVEADPSFFQQSASRSLLRSVEACFRILGKYGMSIGLTLEAPLDEGSEFGHWLMDVPNAVEAYRRRYTADDAGCGRVDIVWLGKCRASPFYYDWNQWEMLYLSIYSPITILHIHPVPQPQGAIAALPPRPDPVMRFTLRRKQT